jgi:putative sterol carrier protein
MRRAIMRLMPANGKATAADWAADADRPVFVLTVARSGSTLLRFIMDSHPDLACPPETNVAQACLGLARLWEILRPSPESADRDFMPGEAPDHLIPAAAASIRAAIGEIYGDYVAQRGKRRWCDKSLDSARLAGLLAHVYPDAQFVCLYRHCMDVVLSAVEAAPWGLNGYGFEPYVMGSPGNMVMAAARCWVDQTKAIIDFQDAHLERCHGIRYEDLVFDPEGVARGLFEYLGLAPVPGITSACFAQAHDMRGPGDHKIWFTSQVGRDSLGRGTRVPTQMLPPELLQAVNETLDRLAYRQVDDDWKSMTGPADPRVNVAEGVGGPAMEDPAIGPEAARLKTAVAEISRRLSAVPHERVREFASRWPAAVAQSLAVAIEPSRPGADPAHRWVLSYDEDCALTVRADTPPRADEATLVASSGTWLALLHGEANMAVELRASRLRFLDPADGGRAASPGSLSLATHLLAYLLDLAGAAGGPAAPEQHAGSALGNRNGRWASEKRQPAKTQIPATGR